MKPRNLSLLPSAHWPNSLQTKLVLKDLDYFTCITFFVSMSVKIKPNKQPWPIHSIRNRFGITGSRGRGGQDGPGGAGGGLAASDNFPPSFRINRGYSTASGVRSSSGGLRRSASGTSSALEKARQSRLLSQLKKGTSTLKAALPRIKASLVFSFKFLSTYQYDQIKSLDFFPKMPEIRQSAENN